jgi:hypothetical protein
MTSTALPVRELLRIDYAAERRKLAGANLDAAWRLPAELVRRAVQSGATRIVIRAARRELWVRDDGRAPSAALCAAVARVCDGLAGDARRHQALLLLEAEPGLLAAASRGGRVERASGETRIGLPRFSLEREDLRSLAEALRFCPVPVELDGAPAPRGPGPCFARGPLPVPLSGGLALGAAECAELALVLDGVVVSRLTLPEAPPCAAWLDARSLPAAIAEPPCVASLRDALTPQLPAIVAAAVDLALATVPRLAELTIGQRERLLEILLVAAPQRREVYGAPLLPCLEGGRLAFHSLLDLRRRAEAAGRVAAAVDPDFDPAAQLLPEGPVLLLGASARARVAALLGVRFRPLAPRQLAPGLLARARRALRDCASRLRQTLQAVRRGAGCELSEAELRDDERALVRALGPGVRLTAGAGPVRRAGRVWRLPRANPTVAAAARAVRRDPRWLHPASLALFSGRRPAPPAWAEGWLNPTA